MMPLLITLSVRRAQPGHGEGEGSAVFFVKVGAQHTVQALRDTLCRMLGLTPNAGLPLVFNGALLDPAVRPAEAGLRTGSVIEAALEDDAFATCLRSPHVRTLVDLDDYNLSLSMGSLMGASA